MAAMQPLVLRHDHPVAAICSVANGALLAAGGYDHAVHLWDTIHGERLHVLRGHGETVWALCTGPGAETIVSGGGDNTMRIWAPAERSETISSSREAVGVALDGGGLSVGGSGASRHLRHSHEGHDGRRSTTSAERAAVPLAERSNSVFSRSTDIFGELVRLTLRRVLASLWPEALEWSETEWHDVFGAECTLRRPVSSLIRAWGTVFALGRCYYRRR